MSGLTGSVSAEVFNTNGQVVIAEVKHFKPGETTWILETDKLRPGTYSLSIKSGKKNFESRFVKE
jgi:hypothetical protein